MARLGFIEASKLRHGWPRSHRILHISKSLTRPKAGEAQVGLISAFQPVHGPGYENADHTGIQSDTGQIDDCVKVSA